MCWLLLTGSGAQREHTRDGAAMRIQSAQKETRVASLKRVSENPLRNAGSRSISTGKDVNHIRQIV
jgi:hypothetical protein